MVSAEVEQKQKGRLEVGRNEAKYRDFRGAEKAVGQMII
jgi:hypothetical protein